MQQREQKCAVSARELSLSLSLSLLSLPFARVPPYNTCVFYKHRPTLAAFSRQCRCI